MSCKLRASAAPLFPPEAIPHLEAGMRELVTLAEQQGPAWGAATILLANLFEPEEAKPNPPEDP